MFQRREDRRDRIHAGHQVADRDAGLHRRGARLAVGDARVAHESGHPLEHEIVARQQGARPVLAEAGDRAVDDARVQGADVRVAQPVAPERADLVVLDQHVAVACERQDDVAPVGLREVDGQGLLAAVSTEEIGRVARLAPRGVADERRTPRARVVAAGRALHLDDLGAQVGERLRGPWTRQDPGQVQHPGCATARLSCPVSYTIGAGPPRLTQVARWRHSAP